MTVIQFTGVKSIYWSSGSLNTQRDWQ